MPRLGADRTRLGLAWRIAMAMALLVAGLVAVGVGAVWLRAAHLQGTELERAVTGARDLTREAIEQRLLRLELIGGLLGSDPPFRAYVAEADASSILDNLRERLGLYGCDALLVTDAEGRVLADTRRPASRGEDLSDRAIVRRALQGAPARGAWVDPGGGILLAAAAPILQGAMAPAGIVVAFEAVDDALAGDLTRVTGGELIFFVRDAAGQAPTVEASSPRLPRERVPRILGDSDLMTALVWTGTGEPPSVRVSVGGEQFVAQPERLDTAGEKVVGGFVALRSVDRELTSLRAVQRALIWAGLFAVAAAIATSFALARRITRPIGALVAATERVRAGDYDTPLEVTSDDELGRLADAFRTMTARLKEKEEMDAYLAQVVGKIPASEPAADTSRTFSAAPTHGTFAPGAIVQSRYEILALAGQGGMGAVYRAYDRELGETVALKVLTAGAAASDEMRERFKSEIRLARRITHRNVVRTHDLGESDGSYLLTMEYVDGVSLADLLSRGRLPIGVGLGIARQLLAGLAVAHAQEVVHRDLKPSNLLLDTTGTLKIADFGLARLSAGMPVAAFEAQLAGTPHYMSPEQAARKPADLRSDIYSAGVILFEIFCGRRPFEAETLPALLRMHLHEPPPRPRELSPSLPESLEAILLRALAKDPADRFSSAGELARALEEVTAHAA